MFIDELNLPQLDDYGSQSSSELLRQCLDVGGFYDLQKLHFKRITQTQFIASCAPPGKHPFI